MKLPDSWLEFQKGGTSLRRVGFATSGTWMDPEDAKPRRAMVYYEPTLNKYKAHVGAEVQGCLPSWWGRIMISGHWLKGIIVITDMGFEFKEEKPDA